MKAPVKNLRKDVLVKLASRHCKHGHSYLEHYDCWLKDAPDEAQGERVGFWDIECSNLKADFGYLLSWSIKDGSSKSVEHDVLTMEDLQRAKVGDEDKRIVKSCVAALRRYDRIVTYYGKRFDAPFTRVRALVCGLDFPTYGEMVHTDLYDVIKGKFGAISSRRLENACRLLLGKTSKTRIESPYWRSAQRGDQRSLDYVLDHNIHDVVDLEKLYRKVLPYTRLTKSSV